jgi:adenine-specific DNA-methyltransferase
MDEVFGSENFVSLITFKKTGGQTSNLLSPVSDYIVWYAFNKERVKYNQLYREMRQGEGHSTGERYDQALLPDGIVVTVGSRDEFPPGTRFFRHVTLSSNRPAKEHEKIRVSNFGRYELFFPAAGRTLVTPHWLVITNLVAMRANPRQSKVLLHQVYSMTFPPIRLATFGMT